MKIGIAGLMSLELLDLEYDGKLPNGYKFPMIAHLINGILKEGHQVVAYTTSADISEQVVIETPSLTLCIAPRGAHPGRTFFKEEREALKGLMKQYSCDIIGAQWSYEFAWAALESGVPTVVSLHDHATTILKYMFDPFRVVRWIINFIVLRKARFITANSDYLFNKLTAKEKSKAKIVYNFFPKGLEDNYNAASKANYILTVSNGFGGIKNVTAGLEAFGLLRKERKDIEYHIVGHGMEENGPAHIYALKNNLTEGVKFIGNLSHPLVVKKIKEARILLHPSKEESFGNVILEAMVVGTPVVGGKISGNVPYLLGQGNYGLICDVGNPADILLALNKLIADGNLYHKIRTHAHEYAVSNFSEDIIIKKYIRHLVSVYEKVTKKKVKELYSNTF